MEKITTITFKENEYFEYEADLYMCDNCNGGYGSLEYEKSVPIFSEFIFCPYCGYKIKQLTRKK